jgi:hypothetical protein
LKIAKLQKGMGKQSCLSGQGLARAGWPDSLNATLQRILIDKWALENATKELQTKVEKIYNK